MRIISGLKKGHTILSYKNKEVRPLTNKNREKPIRKVLFITYTL